MLSGIISRRLFIRHYIINWLYTNILIQLRKLGLITEAINPLRYPQQNPPKYNSSNLGDLTFIFKPESKYGTYSHNN